MIHVFFLQTLSLTQLFLFCLIRTAKKHIEQSYKKQGNWKTRKSIWRQIYNHMLLSGWRRDYLCKRQEMPLKRPVFIRGSRITSFCLRLPTSYGVFFRNMDISSVVTGDSISVFILLVTEVSRKPRFPGISKLDP